MDSMIPLGSCTMKLNAAFEMLPLSDKRFNNIHPFVPKEKLKGLEKILEELGQALCELTGFSAVSFQPNAGSQGEYGGLLAIKGYFKEQGEERDTVLIPESAHGTNPASAALCGFKVERVKCDKAGNISLADLKEKLSSLERKAAAIMITYPSTHGVFEADIKQICEAVHSVGAQVYLDGANLNAMVGLVKPAEFGADICHINLHKTFCIPHGGGGPGAGPLVCKPHLASYLPSHPLVDLGTKGGAVSVSPWGNALVLIISWAYIKLMGLSGLRRASQVAILNANYLAKKLSNYFPVLYTGENGFVAHEFILDLREKKKVGIEVEDVAKRLMDFGFHAPTVSFPVIGTLMIEPTESESKEELDRFIEALKCIAEEIKQMEGEESAAKALLKNAPHPAEEACSSEWIHPYSREKAVYPLSWVKQRKFWPPVSRIDNPWGDRNLCCCYE